MKIIICIAVVAIAFALGWNAKALHTLHAIDRVLDMLDKSITEKGELSETELPLVRAAAVQEKK